MSRIGKMPIPVPTGVTVDVGDGTVRVKGPQGRARTPGARARSASSATTARCASSARPTSRPHRSLHGLTRSLIANMVTGVTDGFTRRLEVNGVGYRAAVSAGNLVLQVGFSHPVLVPAPRGISFAVAGQRDHRQRRRQRAGRRDRGADPTRAPARAVQRQGHQVRRGSHPPQGWQGRSEEEVSHVQTTDIARRARSAATAASASSCAAPASGRG